MFEKRAFTWLTSAAAAAPPTAVVLFSRSRCCYDVMSVDLTSHAYVVVARHRCELSVVLLVQYAWAPSASIGRMAIVLSSWLRNVARDDRLMLKW